MTTETLTTAMISTLRAEAAAAGDLTMVEQCDSALAGDALARQTCAAAITGARAMDDSREFVRVIASDPQPATHEPETCGVCGTREMPTDGAWAGRFCSRACMHTDRETDRWLKSY